MVLGFFVETFLDITFYTGLWTIKKTASGIYYILYGDGEDEIKKEENQVTQENQVTEQIKNLQEQIRELKSIIEK